MKFTSNIARFAKENRKTLLHIVSQVQNYPVMILLEQ